MEYTIYNNKKYKNCCGNCEFYLGPEARHNCEKKFGRCFYQSSNACKKYFSFKANIEYKLIDKNLISNYADILKDYCKDRDCNSCKFKNLEKCSLRTKLDVIISLIEENK